MSSSDKTAFADAARRDAEITRSKLVPRYPRDRECPPLTSLFGSWDDVDGTRRDEPHSGVDAGRLGDEIIAPASGTVVAAWKADWGWGEEGALLIQHTRAEMGLSEGPSFYFSEFDHLRFDDVAQFEAGARVARGQRLGVVTRPGGKRQYLPEVHWEVWALDDPDSMKWSTNRHGGRYWTNATADLVDPLRMMSLNAAPPGPEGSVDIPVFNPGSDYGRFRGFTYIFRCPPRK